MSGTHPTTVVDSRLFPNFIATAPDQPVTYEESNEDLLPDEPSPIADAMWNAAEIALALALAAPLRRVRVLQQLEPQLFAVGVIQRPFGDTRVPPETVFPETYLPVVTPVPETIATTVPDTSLPVAFAPTERPPMLLPADLSKRDGPFRNAASLQSAWVRALPGAEERASAPRSSFGEVRSWLQAAAQAPPPPLDTVTLAVMPLHAPQARATATPAPGPLPEAAESAAAAASEWAEAHRRAQLWSRSSPWWGLHALTSLGAGVCALSVSDWLCGGRLWLLWPVQAVSLLSRALPAPTSSWRGLLAQAALGTVALPVRAWQAMLNVWPQMGATAALSRVLSPRMLPLLFAAVPLHLLHTYIAQKAFSAATALCRAVRTKAGPPPLASPRWTLLSPGGHCAVAYPPPNHPRGQPHRLPSTARISLGLPGSPLALPRAALPDPGRSTLDAMGAMAAIGGMSGVGMQAPRRERAKETAWVSALGSPRAPRTEPSPTAAAAESGEGGEAEWRRSAPTSWREHKQALVDAVSAEVLGTGPRARERLPRGELRATWTPRGASAEASKAQTSNVWPWRPTPLTSPRAEPAPAGAAAKATPAVDKSGGDVGAVSASRAEVEEKEEKRDGAGAALRQAGSGKPRKELRVIVNNVLTSPPSSTAASAPVNDAPAALLPEPATSGSDAAMAAASKRGVVGRAVVLLAKWLQDALEALHPRSWSTVHAELCAVAAIYPINTLLERWCISSALPPHLSTGSPWQLAGRMLALEGIGAFWTGLPAALACVVVERAVRVGLRSLRNTMQRRRMKQEA